MEKCCGKALEWEIVSLQCHTYKVMEAKCSECGKKYIKRYGEDIFYRSEEGKITCTKCNSEAKLVELLHDVSVGQKKRTVTEFVPHCPCCEGMPIKLAQ